MTVDELRKTLEPLADALLDAALAELAERDARLTELRRDLPKVAEQRNEAQAALSAAETRAKEAERRCEELARELTDGHHTGRYWTPGQPENDSRWRKRKFGPDEYVRLEAADEWRAYATERDAEATRLREELKAREERIATLTQDVEDRFRGQQRLAAENDTLRSDLSACRQQLEASGKATRWGDLPEVDLFECGQGTV